MGYTFNTPGDLPNQGIEPEFPTLKVDPLQSEPPQKPQETTLRILSGLSHFTSVTFSFHEIETRQLRSEAVKLSEVKKLRS